MPEVLTTVVNVAGSVECNSFDVVNNDSVDPYSVVKDDDSLVLTDAEDASVVVWISRIEEVDDISMYLVVGIVVSIKQWCLEKNKSFEGTVLESTRILLKRYLTSSHYFCT